MKKTTSKEIAVIDPKELEGFNEQVVKAEKFSTSLEVKNNDTYKAALNEGKSIKTQLDIITARKEEITKPMYASYKSVLSLFKPIETAGESALRIIKTKMLAYTSRIEQEAEAAKLKIAKKVESGYLKPETAVEKISQIPEQAKTINTDNGMATTKTTTKYRVVDKTKVPFDFMEVDLVKVKASFRAGTPVAGCEAYEVKELSLY